MRTLLVLTLLSPLVASAATLEAYPTKIKPGDAVLLTVRDAPSDRIEASHAGRPILFYPRGEVHQALLGLPVETAKGTVKVEVRVYASEDAAPETLTAELEVVDPEFRERELRVAKKFIEPPPELQAQIEADRAAFAEAFAQDFGPPVFASDFGWPRNSRITATFGDRRTFNGKLASQHYGLDLSGRTGAPIYAANAGTVVMARDCHASGQTVIIHHGANLYSLYFHLSKMHVTVGQKLRRGHKIGLVGSTGRSTGPHLHWSMKVGDLYVDPRSILRLPLATEAADPNKKTP